MNVSFSGGSGFIGRHLIRELASVGTYSIRSLRRRDADDDPASVSWIRGDLEDTGAIRQMMIPGGTFVHLAFPGDWQSERHLAAAKRLADAANGAGIRRFVHCSTAIVAGNPAVDRITEDTPCRPITGYERSKLEIERTLTSVLSDTVDLVILRPTAVFGPHGRNLVKLARALTTQSSAVNYLRSSLFGRRAMNLVCLDNVVGALRFVIDQPERLRDGVYLVSDDDDPRNNFRDVESTLMRLLGVAPYAVAPVPVPSQVLTAALRAVGRASASPHRIYDSSRLAQAGFQKRVTLADGIERFARWFTGR